jgi:hypothetical protein
LHKQAKKILGTKQTHIHVYGLCLEVHSKLNMALGRRSRPIQESAASNQSGPQRTVVQQGRCNSIALGCVFGYSQYFYSHLLMQKILQVGCQPFELRSTLRHVFEGMLESTDVAIALI